MKPDDLITLNEEIAAMARAGLPLDQGLAALAKEMARGRLQRVTARLAADLRGGLTLPEALERQGDRVPPFYAGLVEAGIRAGRVSEVLATLTLYARSLVNLRQLIVDAAFYPAVVVVFALAIFGLVVYYIIPQYDQTFRDFNMALPLVTQVVVGLSRQPVKYVVGVAAGLVASVLLAWLVLRTTEAGRGLWAIAVYSIPLVGTLIRAARLAAFTELLAILVDYKLPLPRAFEMAGQATSDPLVAGATRRVQKELSEGQPLAAVLRSHRLVPELVAWMAGVGEQRGTLGASLHQVAELYRRQVEMRAAVLRSVLPPLFIIFTAGTFVAFFVMVVILPMVKLLEAISK